MVRPILKGVQMKSVKSLDKTALVNLYNIGGKDFLLRMIDNYLAQSPTRLESARRNYASGDLKAVHLIAHSLKASSANLGASRVQDLAEKLEEMASIGLRERIPETLDKLESVVSEANQCLRSERSLWDLEPPPAA
jgi:HPt (histidine-containing phosphotransfer) domain-containing protein